MEVYMEKTINIEGMSCEGCSGRIERLLNAMDGVYAIVNLQEKKAYVTVSGAASDDALRAAIEDAGYTVTGIH